MTTTKATSTNKTIDIIKGEKEYCHINNYPDYTVLFTRDGNIEHYTENTHLPVRELFLIGFIVFLFPIYYFFSIDKEIIGAILILGALFMLVKTFQAKHIVFDNKINKSQINYVELIIENGNVAKGLIFHFKDEKNKNKLRYFWLGNFSKKHPELVLEILEVFNVYKK